MTVTASQRVTAAVITHSNEVIVCLKVKIAHEDTYIIFDPHAGSISPDGPAFILERRKKTAAELLSDFAASKRPKVSHPDVQKYYARIFCPKESYLVTTKGEDTFRDSLMSSNGRALTETLLYLSRKTASAKQVKQEPTTPTEELTKPKQNSRDELKIDTTPSLPLSDLSPSTNPNTLAHTRLQKEFGWQLPLQGRKIYAPDKSPSDFAQAPRIITASAAPSPSEEVQPSREPRQSPRTPKVSRPIKKDIGWQLALQQAQPSVNGKTTSETISKKVAKSDPVTPPAKRTGYGTVNDDTAKTPDRLASPSTPSKVTPPTQHHKIPSIAQRPSRDDFSWKLALASKSLDPLPRRPIEAPGDERPRPTTLAHVLDPPPSASKTARASTPVDTFICEVCFENFTVSQVARMPDCEHSFCRDCLRSYVKSKLGERQYPILCPVCSADKTRTEPGSKLLDLRSRVKG